MTTDNVFKQVFPELIGLDLEEEVTDFKCLRYMVDTHDRACRPFEDYSLKYVKYLVHVCETSTPYEITSKANILQTTCLSHLSALQ